MFDEWAIVSLLQHQARILAYRGSRNDALLKNFADDLGALGAELLNSRYSVGDFEVARHGESRLTRTVTITPTPHDWKWRSWGRFGAGATFRKR